PNILYEPSKSYKIGKPQDYLEGVTFIADKSIFLVRRGETFKVLSAVCTHLGCTPNWIEEKGVYECPCHGSIFNGKGVVVSGPAPSPLPWYDLTRGTDGRLFVDQRRIVSFSKELIV
ncbi:MAG: ubiquinol-cytochrome c reductase iron-sulfur subunit, partial [Dehalococcoidia bacterium]|nr:ubiquinol-cytochrome c reductase iron-sulfur subunit [Dehalococcoidia bacterium]